MEHLHCKTKIRAQLHKVISLPHSPPKPRDEPNFPQLRVTLGRSDAVRATREGKRGDWLQQLQPSSKKLSPLQRLLGKPAFYKTPWLLFSCRVTAAEKVAYGFVTRHMEYFRLVRERMYQSCGFFLPDLKLIWIFCLSTDSGLDPNTLVWATWLLHPAIIFSLRAC